MSKRSLVKGRAVLSRWLYLLFVVCLPLYAHQGDDAVHLYNWEAFLAPIVIEKLRQDHQISIEQIYFSDESVRDELLLSERGKTIDIVVVESVRLQTLGQLGVVRPIPELRQKLSGRFEHKWMEACGDFGIPYAWGTSGILYRRDKFSKPVDSWETLLKPNKGLDGKVSMYYHPIDLVGVALLSSNKSPFTDDEASLQQAHKLLQTQRSSLASTDYILANVATPSALETIDIAFGYAGDHHVLNEAENKDVWEYVVPNEGTIVWLECLAIPAGSRFREQTTVALDYLTSPEVATLNAQSAWFSTPNANVEALLSREYREDPAISPASNLIEKSFLYTPVSDNGLLIRQRIVEDLR
ncbi:PotD/PotF family extracellular solute-binding protein [Vibrio maritimus]|uniref:ABC transporter substrate-binding protein n=1 Tax=Vibrio maritimus TaxID=990268 RepID=UPI0037364C96